jgi:hypothetical protein
MQIYYASFSSCFGGLHTSGTRRHVAADGLVPCPVLPCSHSVISLSNVLTSPLQRLVRSTVCKH